MNENGGQKKTANRISFFLLSTERRQPNFLFSFSFFFLLPRSSLFFSLLLAEKNKLMTRNCGEDKDMMMIALDEGYVYKWVAHNDAKINSVFMYFVLLYVCISQGCQKFHPTIKLSYLRRKYYIRAKKARK